MSPSARHPRFTIHHSGREEASSRPRQRLVTPPLFSTLSLDFEVESSNNGEGTKNGRNGITLFNKDDIARLSLIVGSNLWNEESDVGFEASKGVSQADLQKEMTRPKPELEKEHEPLLQDTLTTEESVKPVLRDSQSATLSQLAIHEPQHKPITEK